MDRFPYLFAAYAIVWIVLFLYILSLDRRSRRVEKELQGLKQIVESRRPQSQP
jgi:CcmD family protein